MAAFFLEHGQALLDRGEPFLNPPGFLVGFG